MQRRSVRLHIGVRSNKGLENDMDIRRRRYMLDEGEALLVSLSPFWQISQVEAFCESTGLATTQVDASPLIAVPMPRYEAGQLPGRWRGVDPGMLWHPLFWLPEFVTQRLAAHRSREDYDRWAVGVALMMTAGSLYDEQDGSWLDVLSLAGLDSEDAATQNRIRRWVDGESDELLDSIDLTSMFVVPENPGWAWEVAEEELSDLYITAWATAADDLVTDLEISRAEIASGEVPLETMGPAIAFFTTVAMTTLSDEPLLYGDDSWWNEMATAAATASTVMELLGVVENLHERLIVFRDAYWAQMEKLAAIRG